MNSEQLREQTKDIVEARDALLSYAKAMVVRFSMLNVPDTASRKDRREIRKGYKHALVALEIIERTRVPSISSEDLTDQEQVTDSSGMDSEFELDQADPEQHQNVPQYDGQSVQESANGE